PTSVPTIAPRSRCATSTASRSPRWPTTSAGGSTPPRPSSCGPASPSAAPTKEPAMTPDPMDDLRRADQPVAPRPEFTAHLRARLERELGPLPPGGAMSTTTTDPATRPPLRTVTPYLAVSDARAALAWYQDIFGATLASDPIVMPDGRVGHVELRIGDA